MLRKKWLWLSVALCCFILAGFAAKGYVTPQHQVSAEALIAYEPSLEPVSTRPAAPVLSTSSKGERAVAVDAGIAMPILATGEAAHRMLSNEESVSPFIMAPIPLEHQTERDPGEFLDTPCTITNGGALNLGGQGTASSTAFWLVDPAVCAGATDYPFLLQQSNFTLYAWIAGTVTYRVHVTCPVTVGDNCSGPGVDLWTSPDVVAALGAGQSNRIQLINSPAGICVSHPVFIGVEIVSFTGAGFWPTVVWSSTALAPACTQFRCVSGACTDWTAVWATAGKILASTLGNTQDACTPAICEAPEPCVITCVGTPEGEPICADNYVDMTNAGCNVTPNNFGNVACGETICGTSGTFLSAGNNTRETDWFEVSFATSTQITWCARGEFPMQIFVIQPGIAPDPACDSLAILASASAATCSLACITMNVSPGTYWLWVGPNTFSGVPCGADYEATLTCTPILCQPDFTTNVSCAGASTPIQGNTTGASDPCGIGIETELWQLNVTEAGRYMFNGCGGPEAYDQFLYLFDQNDCCVAYICGNDDSCGTVGGLSVIECCDLAVGTYFLGVSGFAAGNVGQYAIQVSCCPPCEIVCTNNEGEPDCGANYDDTFNGGCSATTPVFSAISCGQTVCGASGTFLVADTNETRDMDWYEVTITESMTLTWTWNAEFFGSAWIIGPPCGSEATVMSGTSEPCSTGTISACVDVGTYYLVIAPSDFTGVPCGATYQATLTCAPCEIISTCDPNAVFSQPIDTPADDWTFGVSDVQGDLHRFEDFTITPGTAIGSIGFWGVTTMGSTFDACLEQPMTFEISVYPDLAGAPDFTAGPTCRDTADLTGQTSGFVYSSTLLLPAYYYELTYAEGLCCSLTTGWIGVKGISTGAPDDCRFLWGSSGGSVAGYSLLYINGVLDPAETFDLSLCLNACPVPCDPVPQTVTIHRDSLTMTTAAGYVTLRWTAPQAGTYQVYRTTNPNNDGNADGPDADSLPGDDPDWVLADSPVVGAGAALWNAPAGFDPYVNFLVYHVCP